MLDLLDLKRTYLGEGSSDVESDTSSTAYCSIPEENQLVGNAIKRQE